MRASGPVFSASEAARRLGVSNKALRIYEQRGLVIPGRTAAGYRAYGPRQMARAAEVVALRALGLSLGQVVCVLEGDAQSLQHALAAHEATLESEIRKRVDTVNQVRHIRAGLARGESAAIGELTNLLTPSTHSGVVFSLPWPWGGERFELREIRPLTYIVGPLGSGKTRFAQRLAESIPNAAFVGLDRLNTVGADPLTTLLASLEAKGPSVMVVDMVEQGLDQPTQEALITQLRSRASEPGARPLFLMTRSSSILDLLAVGPDEAILFCPANHSPPVRVAPYPDAPGFEAVAMCLASPEVRARTAGVTAVRRSSGVTG